MIDWPCPDIIARRGAGRLAPELVVRDRGAEREMVAREGGASMVWSRVRRAVPARSGRFYVELFHLAAARALRRGGAAAFNAIGPLAGEGPVQALERVARRELDDVRLVPVLDAPAACIRYGATACTRWSRAA